MTDPTDPYLVGYLGPADGQVTSPMVPIFRDPYTNALTLENPQPPADPSADTLFALVDGKLQQVSP